MKKQIYWTMMFLGLALIAISYVRATCGPPPTTTATRLLYAVDEGTNWGKISVYNIDSGHSLNRIISTVSGVDDIWGVAASVSTGKLYVAYHTASNPGNLFALNLYNDTILWNKVISPDIDRISISPDGTTIYAPTSEDQNNNFINILDAATGNTIRTVVVSNHSHDTLYPLSGPVFQETKASDGSGRYLYRIDPSTYAVTSGGQFKDFLGPYSVNSTSTYAVANVNGVFGFQVENLATNAIATATIPYTAPSFSLLHGIAWSPDETEVWQNTTGSDPHVYVWNMSNPMSPAIKQQLTLSNGGSHWVNFDIKGDYAYISPNKNSTNGTEVFNAITKTPVTTIASTEDELEVDFDANGVITAVGDQYGIGRAGSAAVTTPAPANSVSLSTFGTAGQGGNDTSVIQSAINSTASSGKQLVIPAGNYNTSTLNVGSGANVYLQAGATITAVTGFTANQVLVQVTGSNVTIAGVAGQSVFQGRKSEYTDGSEYRHCMSIESSNNVTINGISCNNSGGDGVYLSGAISTTIENSTFNNNSRDGSSIINVSGLLIDHCTFSNTNGNPNGGSAPAGPWAGIDMEPNVTTDKLQNVTVQNSSFTSNGGNGILVTTGNQSSAAGPISITLDSNTSNGNSTRGVVGTAGYAFWNGINNSPNNQTGTVTLKNSTSTNDGGYGVVARFWDYSNPGTVLSVQNVTITNPQKVISGSAAFAINAGGGDAAPAGNISFSGMTVNYTGGYSLPYYFDFTPFNSGGIKTVSLSGLVGSGQSATNGLGLLNNAPVNSVNIP